MNMSEREPDCRLRAMRREDGGIDVVTRNLTLRAEGQSSLDLDARHPSSLDLMVSALATDLLAGLAREAVRRGVSLDDAELSLAARLDNPLVAIGVEGESGSPALAEVTGTLYLSADVDEPTLDGLWQRALARASVYSTLRQSTTIRIDLKLVS